MSNSTSQSNIIVYERSIQDEINTIGSVTIVIGRWIFPIFTLIGVISNILNIYVFTRPSLRKNPCCMYFLSSSVAALAYVSINMPLRSLQYAYNIDPTIYSVLLCKIKFFLTATWRSMAVWYLVLACLDRFLHSSSTVKLRRLSSFKVACYTIPITFVLINLIYIHMVIFYNIYASSVCTYTASTYGLFLGIWHLVAYGFGPPLLMLLFSLLTIRHIHRRRVVPVLTQTTRGARDSNKDQHLQRMVFIQCIFVGSTTLTYGAYQLYISLTANQTKDRLQLAKDGLFGVVIGITSAIGHSTTFFAFTLTSRLFRQELLCRRR